MSKKLVELSADMASFNNVKPDVVLAALQSGLAGQVRPLRQYGVFLSAARIQTEAYADGIAKQGSKLTQAEKVQAAYNIILKDTTQAQGDVARNAQSLSVAQSKLTAELQDAEATIGGALRPELARLATEAAVYLDTANRTGSIQKTVNTVLKDAQAVIVGVKQALTPFVETFKLLEPLFGGAAGEVKALTLAFVGFEAVVKISALARIAGGVAGIGSKATVATGEVAGLRAGLAGLSGLQLAAITIPIAIEFEQGLQKAKGRSKIVKDLSAAAQVGQFLSGGFPGLKAVEDAVKAGIEATAPKATQNLGPLGGLPAGLQPSPVGFVPPAAAATTTPQPFHVGKPAFSEIKKFSLPYRLQLAQASALDQKSAVQAAKDTAAWVRNLISSGRLVGQARLDAYAEFRSDLGTIEAADKQAADAAKQAATKAANAAKAAAKKAADERKKQAAAAAQWNVPLPLQLAQAKASATVATADDMAVQRKIKTAAEKVLRSGKKSVQGQIDAWNAISAANQALTQTTTAGLNAYHKVSSAALTAGLNLNRATRMALEERIAQSNAHGGSVPSPAAQGIIIHNLNLPSVTNTDKFLNELQRKARGTAVQTRGRHGGTRLGIG